MKILMPSRVCQAAEKVEEIYRDIKFLYYQRRFKYHDKRANHFSEKIFGGKTVFTCYTTSEAEKKSSDVNTE